MDLHELFKRNQDEMISSFNKNSHIDHPGEKGDDTNLRWIRWFEDYLPKRYCADKAIIIDCDGNTSHQIDVVVYDRNFSPPLMTDSSSKFIMAESVYAVFESKQNITKGNLEYAMKKVESVRKLKRTFAPFRESQGVTITEPKPIIGGILSKTSVDLNNNELKEYIYDQDKMKILNLGCSLEDGSFILSQNEVVTNTNDTSFIWFFYNLLSELRNLGSVPAIDYSEYLRY